MRLLQNPESLRKTLSLLSLGFKQDSKVSDSFLFASAQT